MKIKILTVATLIMIGSSMSCKKFLDTTPQGVLSASQLNNPTVVEGLVTASYSSLDYHFPGLGSDFLRPASNWSYSDIRSDDAYKGGGGTGDIQDYNNMELGNVTTDNATLDQKFRGIFYAIQNCNKALKALETISASVYPNKNVRIAEVHVLRGHFYFDLKKNFYTFPYVDESVAFSDISTIGTTLTSDQLWTNIENDFKAGIAGLPASQTDIDRVNVNIAHAYLCKTYLYQKKWQLASQEADAVINSGKYGLMPDFEQVYSLPQYEHGPEFVFSIAFSVHDGTTAGTLNLGDLLCAPLGPVYNGGDGFHRPTQNLVNAFKVDANGLPLLTTFNQTNLTNADFVDPRLDRAVGRPGYPWKDYTLKVQDSTWARTPETYGYFVRKKNIISPNSPLRATSGFPWALGALDYPLIKYSDVLLWKAEALIELGTDLDGARQLINQIRQRAATAPVVTKLNSTVPAGNYRVGLYPAAGWTQDYARQALQFERRLELCLEGQRFYDLVRWGIAASTMNAFYQQEAPRHSFLSVAKFTPNRNEYLPIPQAEIDLSHGLWQQNAFYK